jgi:dCMP deaminase
MDSPRALRSSPRFMSMTKETMRQRSQPPEEPEERISWNDYFLKAATLASIRSPCDRLKVGCVIVKNNRLISMGYNGFLAGTDHRSIVRWGHEQATIHAEINAITDAAKRGVSIDDSVAYITHYPCINCFKALASSGVKKIYYQVDYKNDPILEDLGYGISLIKL